MTDIKQEIAALKQRLAELEAKANAPQSEWPRVGDDVYHLNSFGFAETNPWRNTSMQESMLERGLIKRTREEAENADKKRIAIAKWNRLAGDQGWAKFKPFDRENPKYYPVYNHQDKKWYSLGYSCTEFQCWPFAHHKTETDCEAAIKEMGEMMDWILL